jgi:hypothetical protein
LILRHAESADASRFIVWLSARAHKRRDRPPNREQLTSGATVDDSATLKRHSNFSNYKIIFVFILCCQSFFFVALKIVSSSTLRPATPSGPALAYSSHCQCRSDILALAKVDFLAPIECPDGLPWMYSTKRTI